MCSYVPLWTFKCSSSPLSYTLGNNVGKKMGGVLKVGIEGAVHFYVGPLFQQVHICNCRAKRQFGKK